MNRALALFWRKGYQATSLADLLAAMDIGRSSFYAAFTDKRTLYIACMELFAERVLAMLERARLERPPLDVLHDFLAGRFAGGRTPRATWGCLQVNSVIELAGVDEDLVARASIHLFALQRFFVACLRDAGAPPGQADEFAAMLMLVHEGMRVSSRRRLPDARHLHAIDTTFRLIRGALALKAP